MNPVHSAVYEGRVVHRRHLPRAHAFRYRIAQLYLDLDEVGRVFERRWLWSVDRRNLGEWRRSDYLGPACTPLKDAVLDRVEQATGERPGGAVRMLCHPRYAGYVAATPACRALRRLRKSAPVRPLTLGSRHLRLAGSSPSSD